MFKTLDTHWTNLYQQAGVITMQELGDFTAFFQKIQIFGISWCKFLL